jgi:hypothetical protein
MSMKSRKASDSTPHRLTRQSSQAFSLDSLWITLRPPAWIEGFRAFAQFQSVRQDLYASSEAAGDFNVPVPIINSQPLCTPTNRNPSLPRNGKRSLLFRMFVEPGVCRTTNPATTSRPSATGRSSTSRPVDPAGPVTCSSFMTTRSAVHPSRCGKNPVAEWTASRIPSNRVTTRPTLLRRPDFRRQKEAVAQGVGASLYELHSLRPRVD